VSNRTRLVQELILLISLVLVFFAWLIIGGLIGFMVSGRLLELSPLWLLLTLPTWPLWLLHGVSIGVTGTSLLTTWFSTRVPVMELIADCAILNAVLLGIPIIVYFRRHAW
jgi:hypothetical protein